MSLSELQEALDEGRTSDLRAILVGLDDSERALLKAEVGEESYEQIYGAAARRVRGAKRGKVILLHGIMGADLDVWREPVRHRVWLRYLSLILGNIEYLQLKVDGTPRDRKVTKVVVRGQMKKYYLPPLLELENHWHARPFAYDWRLDIRKSADLLAELIESFGQGEPVHLVAHSMGGLVSRSFIERHRDLWARCDDPDGHKRGGRLVMLGTPNYGSYTIPMVFTGDEKQVKTLAKADLEHSLADVRRIVNSFPGSYQMLPSPLETSTDDRAKLYDIATWGNLPVKEQHLADARRFHESLRPIVDPDRFLYVAGTNQKTPAAVEVKGRKKLRYAYTRAGDGRVPHELGLLPGVRTYYVDQAHGNLPIDKDVLRSIHELLSTGATDHLDTSARVRRRGMSAFEEPDEEVLAELGALLATEKKRRGSKAKPSLSPEDQRRFEGLLLDDSGRSRGEGEKDVLEDPKGGKKPEPTSLKIDVVWGDVVAVRADIYAVGHYQGVLPQKAEWALDRALSGTSDPDEQVLRQHTLRGHLRGALGDIDLFPWPGGSKGRAVAVAGMGAPGSFSPEALRFLIGKLAWVVANQPNASTIATVLIGSGEGTLSIAEAVRSYLGGIRDALERGDILGGNYRLRFVELDRHRAMEILEELKRAKEELKKAKDDGLAGDQPDLRISSRLGMGRDRRMDSEEAFRILASEVDSDPGPAKKHFDALVDTVKQSKPQLAGSFDQALKKYVEEIGDRKDKNDGKLKEPIRMSFSRDPIGIRVAAITMDTTVSERILRFDMSLLEELIQEVNVNEDASVEELSSFVTRLLLPAEFRKWIAAKGGAPFVFEVDREMARVHWEMLDSGFTESETRPLATMSAVSRQLRTTYSPPPAKPLRKQGPLKVLVVGDPGDPEVGHDLPGARQEALEVASFLAELPNVKVTTRIGAPGVPRTGALRGHKPAKRLDVLKELVTGDYDILHYCGHGDFDPEDGERAGWVFSEGLITSREIARVESPPPLVVANACLSARTSQAGGGSLSRRNLESKLLPSLADEFFRRGVRNYVGTAWTVNDVGAVLFAKTFYETLLRPRAGKDDKATSHTIGEAVKAARKVLYGERVWFGGLWSAYQHYGDPNSVVRR